MARVLNILLKGVVYAMALLLMIDLSTMLFKPVEDKDSSEEVIVEKDHPQMSRQLQSVLQSVPQSGTNITIYEAFKPSMTERNKEMMLELLSYFVQDVTKHNLTYFMYSGTLLGSWRHHGFIPWDDDVDLFMNSREKTRLQVLLRKFPAKYSYFAPFGQPRYKIFFTNEPKIIKRKWSFPFLDISFYREKDKDLFDIDRSYPAFHYKKDSIFPLVQRPFENLTLLAPRDSFGVISTTYDVASCTTADYNHIIEKKNNQHTSVPCDILQPYLPFVFRKAVPGGLQEELRIGTRTLGERFTPQ